jgi:hypothetical protein
MNLKNRMYKRRVQDYAYGRTESGFMSGDSLGKELYNALLTYNPNCEAYFEKGKVKMKNAVGLDGLLIYYRNSKGNGLIFSIGSILSNNPQIGKSVSPTDWAINESDKYFSRTANRSFFGDSVSDSRRVRDSRRIADFEFAGEAVAENDIRDYLASVIKEIVYNHDEYIGGMMGEIGGAGDSCGVIAGFPAYMFFYEQTGYQSIDNALDEEYDYIRECAEADGVDVNDNEAIDDYIDKYEDDEICLLIGVRLEGDMETGRGWAWNASKINSINQIQVFSEIQYRSTYKVEAKETLFEGQPIQVSLGASKEGELDEATMSQLEQDVLNAFEPIEELTKYF